MRGHMNLAQKEPYYVTGATNNFNMRNAARAHIPSRANLQYQDSNNNAPGIIFNEDLKRSLTRMEKLMQIETKLEAARVRRSNTLHLKESASRAANQRHVEVSQDALQRKWVEEEERARQAFLLKQSSDDQLVLRKVSGWILCIEQCAHALFYLFSYELPVNCRSTEGFYRE